MTTTLVLSYDLAAELLAATRSPLETAGVLLVSVVHTDVGTRLLGRAIRWVPEEAYITRNMDSLSIASAGYVPALAQAEHAGAAALWVHTHPGDGAIPLPSNHDELVDRQLAEVFRLRSGSSLYGALIVSPHAGTLTYSGHIQCEGSPQSPIDRVWIVGDRFQLLSPFGAVGIEPLPCFDRNVRAFGEAIQKTLSSLHVGIVGCGGTGSVVAEQLVRLGVRTFSVVDPDTLSKSNVTRVYGSTMADVGRNKVEILADHLRSITPDVTCMTWPSMVTSEHVARSLSSCDVIFGCTDDNAGRLVLSRMATYLLTPVIDCGVLLSSDQTGSLMGIDGRITTLVPGQACLVCRGRIDLRRAEAEMRTPEERLRLENEGYAPALGRIEPAVVTFTTLVGATAVNELLERLIGYGPSPRPSEVLLRCHDREISTNVATPGTKHYCHPQSGKIGLGITDPYLEQVWLA